MTWTRLERCTGPACPNCGCEDAEILEQPKPSPDPKQGGWWGSGRAECNACGREFRFKELPKPPEPPADPAPVFDEPANPVAVLEPPQVEKRVVPVVKCPDCGGEMKITSSRKVVRYHKCPKCGQTAKTAR